MSQVLKVNKYRNVRVKSDGISFDSKKEERRYQDLKLLYRAGEITYFIVHPVFMLQESFLDNRTGKRERAITYEGDFAVKYIDLDHWVVEDIKGGNATKTRDFNNKRKMFIKRYPCLELRLL